MRIPVDGGEEIPVLPSVTFFNFVIVPEGIYFIPRTDPGEPYFIHFLSFATGRSRAVLRMAAPPGNGLTVSRDGGSILYTQIDERRSDLMLVDNFR